MRLEDVFHNCPRCAAPGFKALTRKHRLCSACGFDFFVSSANAVGALMPDPSGRLLFLRRSHEPGRGMLGLPGGFIDMDETAEDALRREVREEIDLALESFSFLASFPNFYVWKGITYPVLDLFFVCQPVSWAPLRIVEEADELVFADPRSMDLDSIAFPSVRRAVERYAATI